MSDSRALSSRREPDSAEQHPIPSRSILQRIGVGVLGAITAMPGVGCVMNEASVPGGFRSIEERTTFISMLSCKAGYADLTYLRENDNENSALRLLLNTHGNYVLTIQGSAGTITKEFNVDRDRHLVIVPLTKETDPFALLNGNYFEEIGKNPVIIYPDGEVLDVKLTHQFPFPGDPVVECTHVTRSQIDAAMVSGRQTENS